jgi:hypothetical protein
VTAHHPLGEAATCRMRAEQWHRGYWFLTVGNAADTVANEVRGGKMPQTSSIQSALELISTLGERLSIPAVGNDRQLRVHVEQTFQIASGLHNDGKLCEADRLYQFVLAERPSHYGSLLRSGLLRAQANQMDEAVHLFGRAVAVQPNAADASDASVSRLRRMIASCSLPQAFVLPRVYFPVCTSPCVLPRGDPDRSDLDRAGAGPYPPPPARETRVAVPPSVTSTR